MKKALCTLQHRAFEKKAGSNPGTTNYVPLVGQEPQVYLPVLRYTLCCVGTTLRMFVFVGV